MIATLVLMTTLAQPTPSPWGTAVQVPCGKSEGETHQCFDFELAAAPGANARVQCTMQADQEPPGLGFPLAFDDTATGTVSGRHARVSLRRQLVGASATCTLHGPAASAPVLLRVLPLPSPGGPPLQARVLSEVEHVPLCATCSNHRPEAWSVSVGVSAVDGGTAQGTVAVQCAEPDGGSFVGWGNAATGLSISSAKAPSAARPQLACRVYSYNTKTWGPERNVVVGGSVKVEPRKPTP